MNQSEFLAIPSNLFKSAVKIRCKRYDWFWFYLLLLQQQAKYFCKPITRHDSFNRLKTALPRLTSTDIQSARPVTNTPATPNWEWCVMKGNHRPVLKPYNQMGRTCSPQMANTPAGVLNPKIYFFEISFSAKFIVLNSENI